MSDCCRDLSQIVDNGEGSMVCSTCGLVQEAVLDGAPSHGRSVRTWDFPMCDRAKCRALSEFGFRFSPKTMDQVLVDWAENGLLPSYIIDKTVYRALQTLDKYQKPRGLKKKKTLCSLTDFSAIALYASLLEEKIPRSMNLISAISGVPVKRLWTLDGIFYPNPGLDRLPKPSAWMPGISYFLPLSFKEIKKICHISDRLYEDFSFRPLTVLSTVILAYMEMRDIKFSSTKKRLTKKQISEITGVSVTSMMRGLNEMFGNKPPPYWDILRPEE